MLLAWGFTSVVEPAAALDSFVVGRALLVCGRRLWLRRRLVVAAGVDGVWQSVAEWMARGGRMLVTRCLLL